MGDKDNGAASNKQGHGFLGSLREALAAASKDDTAPAGSSPPAQINLPASSPPPRLMPPELPTSKAADDKASNSEDSKTEPRTSKAQPARPSASEAVRDARGGTPNIPPADRHVEFEAPPTTRVMRAAASSGDDAEPAPRTQMVRGKQKIQRQDFARDPVVGWLVIVGGPGLGAFRPIYEGNNTVGRGANQRIAIDFGDEAISSEEQAYIRYDSTDRNFLFVPNLSKTNVVAINDRRPTTAVTLNSMDVIMMGRTQLVFVPFCGPDFDWSEISDATS